MKVTRALILLFCLIPFLLPAEEADAETKAEFIKKVEQMGMFNITETPVPLWARGSMTAKAIQSKGGKLALLEPPSDVGEITTTDFVFRATEYPILASVKGQRKDNRRRIVCLLTKKGIISICEQLDDPGIRLVVTIYLFGDDGWTSLYLR